MTETIVWTVIFVGGDILVLIGLLAFAMHKDRQKMRASQLE